MYGDTSAMRRRAGQLREQGTDLRALADHLVARVEAMTWQGRAARDLRARVTDRAVHLHECAARHEDAAEALVRHGVEVDRLKESIAGVERKASSLTADARALARFTPPPPGHKDWLTVELPGL